MALLILFIRIDQKGLKQIVTNDRKELNIITVKILKSAKIEKCTFKDLPFGRNPNHSIDNRPFFFISVWDLR